MEEVIGKITEAWGNASPKWQGVIACCELSQLNSELAVAYLKDVESEAVITQEKLAKAQTLEKMMTRRLI